MVDRSISLAGIVAGRLRQVAVTISDATGGVIIADNELRGLVDSAAKP